MLKKHIGFPKLSSAAALYSSFVWNTLLVPVSLGAECDREKLKIQTKSSLPFSLYKIKNKYWRNM